MSSLLKTTTPCVICCADSNPTLTLPCGCDQICIECLGHWISSKVSPIYSNILLDQNIPCPLETCKTCFTIPQVHSERPASEKLRVHEALLKVYFSKEKNTQKHPKALTPCPKGAQCGLCQTKWRNKNYGLIEKEEKARFLKKLLRKSRNIKNEILTFFWKVFNTKKCPDCKVRIAREPGGCKMMACTWCRYQFCWHCLKDGTSCYHEIQREESGKPRANFDLGLYFFAVIYAMFCLAISTGALWILKTIGSQIISGLVSLLEEEEDEYYY